METREEKKVGGRFTVRMTENLWPIWGRAAGIREKQDLH